MTLLHSLRKSCYVRHSVVAQYICINRNKNTINQTGIFCKTVKILLDLVQAENFKDENTQHIVEVSGFNFIDDKVTFKSYYSITIDN